MTQDEIVDTYLAYYRGGVDMVHWYTEAHRDIILASKHLGVRPEYLAGLLAAFSPRATVKASCKMAVHYARTGQFLSNVPKPVRTHVLKFIELGQVAGPKTGDFYRCLVGDTQAVCIDSHMLAAAGFPRTGTKVSMQSCKDAVREVAYHRCPPAGAQAAIWCGYLRTLTDKALSAEELPILEVVWDVYK